MKRNAGASGVTNRFGPEPDGATALTAEELDELIPKHLTTKAELNEWEQANILEAQDWRGRPKQLLTRKYVTELHRRMFGNTWRWAGQFRRTLKNIGVPPEVLATELEKLLADVGYWVEHKTYPPDEIGVRFHHRLVAIHLFPNGNGRHAREITDRLLVHLGQPRLTWGAATLNVQGEARTRYLEALRAADRGEIWPLRDFANA